MRPTFVKLELGLVSKPQFDAVIPAHLAWLAELELNAMSPAVVIGPIGSAAVAMGLAACCCLRQPVGKKPRPLFEQIR